MAQLRKLNSGLYRARIRFRVNKIQREKYVGLDTDNLKIAGVRLDEVDSKEKYIKEGSKVEWSWNCGERRSKIKIYRLGEVSNLWLESRKNSIHITKSHYQRNIISIDRLIDVLGEGFRIEDIADRDIEQFKSFYSEQHTKAGININLRAIKTFFRWCFDNQYIDRVPKIVIRNPKQEPKYIREDWFSQIMDLDIEDHWKKAFKLYVTTGARKREIFNGYIDGSFLIVPAEKTKTKTERIIKLNSSQKSVVREMQKRHQTHIDSEFDSYTFIDRYNKIFVKCLKKIGVYRAGFSLHSLRHTFAIMRYLQTRDIYLVKNEMGHSSITTTEVYSNMNIHLILEHFPSFRCVRATNRGLRDYDSKVISFTKPLKLQRTSNP